MSSRLSIALLIVKIFGDILALVELPQVDKNNILETDLYIRETTNKLFSILRLKVNASPALKQYSLIHNYLVSTSLQDYTNLIEIAKLTRVDKIKLNNQTKHFMAILNEILNEDIKHDTEIKDGYVIKHIEGFLKNLDEYSDSYKYKENNVDYIVTELLKILDNKDTFSQEHFNDTLDKASSWPESSSENSTLINKNEFWEPSGRRIYSGRKASIKDFPFMASIQIFNHFQCAGSIIKSDLIITAASCLQLAWNNRFFRENPAFLSARVGSTFHNVGGENIPILEVYFHPAYDPRSLKNNLALLRLHRALKFSKKIKRLKKIPLDRHDNPLPVNTRGITIVGWGARRRSNVIEDPFLSFAVLDFYLLEDCQDVYSKKYVTRKHFCAGSISVGSGACNRDIGGPGIARGRLTGIISFGSPVCGTPDAPTVFTKIGYYTEWIDGIMDQHIHWGKSRTSTLGPQILTIPTEYVELKTTFKLRPPVFNKKPKLLNEELLRISNDKYKDEVNTFDKSKEYESILRKATTKMKNIKSTKDDISERIPFSYSPVTTLEPLDHPSTQISDIKEEEVNTNENGLVKELFSSLIGSKEVEDLIRQASKPTELNTSDDYLVQNSPLQYHNNTTSEPQELSSNIMGIMKADDISHTLNDASVVTLQKSIDEKYKGHNNNKNAFDTQKIKEKDNQLNAKLEEDIIKILDEINLEDYLIKERKTSENIKEKLTTASEDDNKIKDIFTLLYLSDSEQKDITGILSGESETSGEDGLEIIPDEVKNISIPNNKKEETLDSDKVLYQIVTDVLKEELVNKFNDKDFNVTTDKNDYKINTFNDELPNVREKEFSREINAPIIRAVTDNKIKTSSQKRKSRKHTRVLRNYIKNNKTKMKNNRN